MAGAVRHRREHRRRPQGHPRGRREHRHDQEALRHDRRRVDRGEPARLPEPALHDGGHGGLHRRRDPLRRDDPPGGGRRDAVRRAPRRQGRRPGDQGRHGRARHGGLPRREGHRGARRPARAARGVRRARRAVREVARRDHDRRRHPDRRVPPRERARPRPVRGALPGGGPRADRRARGPDGRRPHDRDLRRRDGADAAGGVRRALRPGHPPARDAAEAEHGDRRPGRADAGAARARWRA